MQLDHSTSAIHHTAATLHRAVRSHFVRLLGKQSCRAIHDPKKRRPRVSATKKCVHTSSLFISTLGPGHATIQQFGSDRYQISRRCLSHLTVTNTGPSTNKPPSSRIPHQWHRIDFYPMDKNSRPTLCVFQINPYFLLSIFYFAIFIHFFFFFFFLQYQIYILFFHLS